MPPNSTLLISSSWWPTPCRIGSCSWQGRCAGTYAELDERANRFGHHLLDQGAEAGDHIGILARNRAEWVESMIGCDKARTVPVDRN